jgi:hypothetical protein
MLEMLVRDKHSMLLGPFISTKENEDTAPDACLNELFSALGD